MGMRLMETSVCFGSLPKRAREVEDVFDGGWVGVVMVIGGT